MEEILEQQTKLIEPMASMNASKEEFIHILKLVSPGTPLRMAIDGIVESKRGGLIVIENKDLEPFLDGGFKINCRFTPQRLIELAKMDGAIILSENMKRIVSSNVTLAPSSKILTQETGTRHKASERIAKQVGTLSIAVSERKNTVNLYYKNLKHTLKDKSELMRRTTETLQVLEKERELFDQYVHKLNNFELKGKFDFNLACKAIQKGKIMEKIIESQEKMLIELGTEGGVIKLRIKELMKDVIKETEHIIRDYSTSHLKKTKTLLLNLTYDDLLIIENIHSILARLGNVRRESVSGWRILSGVGLAEKEIGMLLREFKSLTNILNLQFEELDVILGQERAVVIKKEIDFLKNRERGIEEDYNKNDKLTYVSEISTQENEKKDLVNA